MRNHDEVGWINRTDAFRSENVPFVYTTELAPQKQLLIPRITRGREVAAYLSYVVDFYDHLPKYSMFIHAAHDQPHNDLFGPETASVLSNLRLQSVDAHGFVNLRCSHQPGCQASVHPTSPTQTDIGRKDIRAYFAQAYQELFDIPLGEVPAHIGNICCCQFAVSRERIRARPRGDYERMLDWAADTNLTNDYGVGWVFEKVWHIVFLMEPTQYVHQPRHFEKSNTFSCPPYEQCRCDNYGWCGPLASEETLHAVTSSRGPFGIW